MVALALSAAALAQQTFDVASLKPSAPMAVQAMVRAQDAMYDSHPPGWLPTEKTRLALKNRPLAGLIASAYRVRASQVSGPGWIQDARFDIEATFPAGTSPADLDAMLRGLLEDRFGLAVHREEKEASGYALVVAKSGAKLTPAAEKKVVETPQDDEARKAAMDKMMEESRKHGEELRKQAAAYGGNYNSSSWRARSVTLAEVADWLTHVASKPVVDASEIDGKYDLDLQVARFGDDTPEYAAGQALAKFGLKLEGRKVTVGTVVVDKVERTVKEN